MQCRFLPEGSCGLGNGQAMPTQKGTWRFYLTRVRSCLGRVSQTWSPQLLLESQIFCHMFPHNLRKHRITKCSPFDHKKAKKSEVCPFLPEAGVEEKSCTTQLVPRNRSPPRLLLNSLHDAGAPQAELGPVGARLRKFSHKWVHSQVDPWAIEIVSQGYKLEFEEMPPHRYLKSALPASPLEREIVLAAIHKLYLQQVVVKVPLLQQGKGYYSTMFVVPKPDRSVRPILNLRSLNIYLKRFKFKMESLREVITSLEGGDFMVSLDIKDAYLHVPIYPPHQAYLRFVVHDCHYQFQTLPFGLSTAPRIFTKVMAEMMVLLRKQGVTVIPYLDDLLIKARSREQLLISVARSREVLQQHGWILNIPKSQLIPTTRLPFLGMILDTDQKRVYLPTEKAQELMTLVRDLLKPKQVSVHHCTRVLGKMVASYEAIPFGRFHARTFQWDLLDKWSGSHLQMHRLITLSPRARVSLLWWLQSAHLLEGRRFGIQDWVLVTTNASLRGWGAVTQGSNFQGLWSCQETCLHINILELRAIYNALSQAETLLRDKSVLIQSDNITAVAHVNRQGGTRSRVAMAEATRILRWAGNHVRALSAVFIPGVDNWEADFLSRHDLHPGEWGLHQEVFAQIASRWELPQVDMMASRLNTKLQRYCARSRDPQAIAVDALVTTWVFQSVYVFPPLPLIPKVLRIIRKRGVRTILIVPDWPRRTWYPELQGMLTEDPWPLPLRQDLLQQGPCLFQDLPRLRLTAWRLNAGS
ncbi:uncharacterized protein LOC134945328 [Pseudophryne corroboree]|uniref:uncharacterized protein LOC134945328 n=1 Tax=Pseudophryne corroboree TaxID=495146 RepID=UPI0030819322